MRNKVVFFSFSLGEGSVSDYFIELAKQFNENYDVVIFSDRIKPDAVEISKEIEIKYWPSKRPTKFIDAKFLYSNIKKYNPILTISVFGSVNIFLLIGFLCGVKNRVAWVRTLTTQFPQKKIMLFRKTLFYKLATKIIANSEATKDDAIVNYKIPRNKIFTFPNSVKDIYDLIPQITYPDIRIVYAGRLHSSKGISTLIKAFANVCKKQELISLDIIGTGFEEQNLKKLVQDLQLKKFVNFKGGLAKVKVLEAFKASHIAVVPSISEAFGFTVIEAMSMKTPVIGANNTGIKEIIIDGVTGLLFETENVDDLTFKINYLLTNPALKEKFAFAGYERFLKYYENKKSVKRDFSYFNALIGQQN